MSKFVIASGPVIIEKGKVLLDKHGKDNFWKFPGGTIKRSETLEECAKKRAREELGINVELVKPLKPIMIWRRNKTIILIHYLAKRKGKIKHASHIRECRWIPINNLPKDVGPNIKPILKEIKKF